MLNDILIILLTTYQYNINSIPVIYQAAQGGRSPVSVSSMSTMKTERELRLLPLSPADRDVAHPSFFSRANTLPSPSWPNR